MGLIKAGLGAITGTLADQWKEYFYCEALPNDVLMTKGKKRVSGRSSNQGHDNIITNGSGIVVADGQCMIIVDQGRIVDISAEPGEYIYDTSSEPSIFQGGLGEGVKQTFDKMWERFQYGSEPAKDQRVYYFNTKEITDNKFGTTNPVPFRVVDMNIGLDIDTSVRCNGSYSYRITDPILFYSNVSGNVANDYRKEEIEGMLKTEFLNALQPAFARISALGIRYSALPGHTMELSQAMNDILSPKWKELRGIEIISVGINSITAPPEDENLIKQLQRTAVMRDPGMAAATITGAQADAMRSAAANEGGALGGFIGMGMAQQAGGVNAADLFRMGQPGQGQSGAVAPQTPQAPVAPQATAPNTDVWECPNCKTINEGGKFCQECGTKRPVSETWECPNCKTINEGGKFCQECGTKRP